MSEPRNNDNVNETSPLLHNPDREEAQIGPAPVKDAWQRVFILATITSVASGVLTIVFLIASSIVLTGQPDDYHPPFDLYYYFAPIAGFVSYPNTE